MTEPLLSISALEQLETIVVEALASRDDSTLNILGYGEISVALGWPIENSQFVCKRTPPFTKAEFAAYQALVLEYVQKVRAAGLQVVDTDVVGIERGDRIVAYLVQPMLDSSTLGHKVLRASQPDPEHPFLAALAETMKIVTPNLSIDAQAPNFGWDGSKLALVDVGTPFLWDNAGSLRIDPAPFVRMLPAPTRSLAARELTKLASRWNDPRRVGVDIVANLWREGIPEWVDATVVALNRTIDGLDPITSDEARKFYDEDVKFWPTLKRLQKVERWWRSSVRHQPYDWFIYSSFE